MGDLYKERKIKEIRDVCKGIFGGVVWYNRWCTGRGKRRDGFWLCLGGDLVGLCFLVLGREGEGGVGMI